MITTIEKWVEINAAPERVFNLFGVFESFPRWMMNVREARRLDGRRGLLRSTGAGPHELSGEWEAQVTASDSPRHVAWRAAGSGVNAQVEAELEETRRGTTLMRVLLTESSAGRGGAGAGLFGADPASALEASLERFKQFAEGYDEDATLIARTPAGATVAPPEGDGGARPRSSARPAPPIPPPPVVKTQPAPAAREEKIISTAAVSEGERGGADIGQTPVKLPRPQRDRRSRAPLVYAGLAALLALALGALLWGATRRQQQQSAAVDGGAPAPAATSSPIAEGETPETTPSAPDTSTTPVASDGTAPNATPTSSPEAARSVEDERPGERASEGQPAANEGAALKTALADWVAATNSQQIGEQMAFYAPVVERYYLRKNFSRRAVREDKTRLAERASLINVTVGEPEITYDREGRRATMRFRKEYIVEGSRLGRGEVVQELKWAKTGEGWRIVSERDVRVIR